MIKNSQFEPVGRVVTQVSRSIRIVLLFAVAAVVSAPGLYSATTPAAELDCCLVWSGCQSSGVNADCLWPQAAGCADVPVAHCSDWFESLGIGIKSVDDEKDTCSIGAITGQPLFPHSLVNDLAFGDAAEGGGAQDDAEAVRWWTLAASEGNAQAQCFLGLIYASRADHMVTGFSEYDYKLLRQKAEQGDADAQTELGFRRSAGIGLRRDDSAAVRWWSSAAKNGIAAAQAGLGFMLFHGRGIPQDPVVAHMWLNIAAAIGGQVWRENRDFIEESLSDEEVAEARRLARNRFAELQ